jgi:hypothetical protein
LTRRPGFSDGTTDFQEMKMKSLSLIAVFAGALLATGCSTNGISLSESKLIDNNCSGNGWITNEAWCSNGLGPDSGPWAGSPGGSDS